MEQFPHLDFSLVASEVWWYRDAEAKQTVTAENYKEEWLHRRYEEPSCTIESQHGSDLHQRAHPGPLDCVFHQPLSLIFQLPMLNSKTDAWPHVQH